MPREALITAFLAKHGWDSAARRPLAGDASFRRYERLEGPLGRAVLMDAPPPHEDVRPFRRIDKRLRRRGFSAPKILAEDIDAGLLLLEDFGDGTYTRLLAEGHNERDLYTLAMDVLIALHRLPEKDAVPRGVKPYSFDRMMEEVGRLHAWYLPLVGAPALSTDARTEFDTTWRTVLPQGWGVPTSLVLFDFHVDNLMLLPKRKGVKACGLLDFQDAVAGPITYDILSLLEDARRDIDPVLVADMKQRYFDAFPDIDREAFEASWAVMAAQRHVRVIGTFARLKLRDNKPQYLKHMPRLWRYMDRCLAHPSLARLKAWMDAHVPANLRTMSA